MDTADILILKFRNDTWKLLENKIKYFVCFNLLN